MDKIKLLVIDDNKELVGMLKSRIGEIIEGNTHIVKDSN